jgi:low temperature requirement protein LtrA
MTSGAQLLRKPGQPRQATFLELFFDLVFIFALTRVSQRLVKDITTQRHVVLTEAGQTLLVLLAIWAVWTATTLITDLYDPDQLGIQLLVVATMFASLVMSVAVPEAFGRRGMVFAGAYVAIHLGRGLYLVPALRGHAVQRRAIRVLFWVGVSTVPWIAGALFPESVTRGALWTLAIAIDYGALFLRLPVPRLGRPPESELPVVAEHLSERYRQFFIIALGELILVTGIEASRADLRPVGAAAFVVSFATTVQLWRIYIYRAGERLPSAIATARLPGRLAVWLSGVHLLMVIGIVAISAGFELVIRHPTGHTDAAWAAVILGGPAVFLVGRGAFEYAVFHRWSLSRVVGMAILVAPAPALIRLPPLISASAGAVVLIGVAVADGISGRAPRPQPSVVH